MNKGTRTFRQTKGTGPASYTNKNYAKLNRTKGWSKLLSFFKKGENI